MEFSMNGNIARDENFALGVTFWGEPTDTRPVAAETLDKYREIMPPVILDIWRREGFCQFKNGLYYGVNPDDWQHVVDDWLRGTPFEKFGKFYALTRSAFGCIYLYNQVIGGRSIIDVLYHQVRSGSVQRQTPRMLAIMAAGAFSREPEYEDKFDENEKPLMLRALAKLGPVGWDETFAFEPALALGGTPSIKNVVKVKWDQHFSFLRQLQDPSIPYMDIGDMTKSLGFDIDKI
jgi:hypothetical protein